MKKANLDLPLVSVALITFNHCEFIVECLESVLKQSYQNIEIIVADDCSTDGTREILARYALLFPDKIKLCTASKNLGVTKNHNRAFHACSGKYISWLSGDDVMLPEKVSMQVNFMEENDDCVICYHDLEYFRTEDGTTIYLKSEIDRPRVGSVDTLIQYGCFNGGVSNMIRRIAAPPHGFDERVPIASDWLFWVETLIGGGRIYYIDEVLARHRRHSSNVTTFDVRIPSLSGIQDHLISTEIILSLLPGKSRFVRFRRAYLYSQLRWRDDGIHYDNYLLLSLRNWFRLKVLIALAASRFIGFRR